MVVVLLQLGLECCSGSFSFFLSFFFFFWLCASVLLLGYCLVVEAGCNWYHSILIYFLYRKKLSFVVVEGLSSMLKGA
jgi:hypothetical protein